MSDDNKNAEIAHIILEMLESVWVYRYNPKKKILINTYNEIRKGLKQEHDIDLTSEDLHNELVKFLNTVAKPILEKKGETSGGSYKKRKTKKNKSSKKKTIKRKK